MLTTEQRIAIWKNVLKSISTFHDDVSQTSLTALMDDASCSCMLLRFNEHLDAIGNGKPLAAFWTSYHDMADITLDMLRAAREWDWLPHLPSNRALIPLWYNYDNVNYERFLSYNYATMSRLPNDHPKVHQQFVPSGFSVQCGS